MTTESRPTDAGRRPGPAWDGPDDSGVDAVRFARSTGLREPAHLVTDLLAGISLRGWTVHRRDRSIRVTPPVPANRLQGWQVRVSATVVSAPEVLAACAPLLVETGTAFSFAGSVLILAGCNGLRAPRAGAGLFLTGYPATDEVFRDLVKRLDEATAGLAGPTILTDQPYRPGGLVHYRYGEFDGIGRLGHDGDYRRCVIDPDGNLVEDVHDVGYRPPSWAGWPFDSLPYRPRLPAVTMLGRPPEPVGTTGMTGPAGRPGWAGAAGPAAVTGAAGPADLPGVLVGGRYGVTGAIRHANKGGVYLARDLRTGVDVVLKEARPHVGTDALGRDARDLLGHEARVLRHLAPLGMVPRLLREFVQEDHRFLVEEFLPGHALRDGLGPLAPGKGGPTLHALLRVLAALAGLVARVHGTGVVLRDLSPDNVMLLPGGELRLVDLELAALPPGHPGEPPGPGIGVSVGGAGTAGPGAPEQRRGAPPVFTADLFSLGAVALHLVGVDPALLPDLPPVRSFEDRVVALLRPPSVRRPVPAPLYQIITGLLRPDPVDRLRLDRVIAICESALDRPDEQLWPAPAGDEAAADLPRFPRRHWRKLVDGIVGQLESGLDATSVRPWPETGPGRHVEPCTVQHGVAGTVAVLARLVAHRRAVVPDGAGWDLPASGRGPRAAGSGDGNAWNAERTGSSAAGSGDGNAWNAERTGNSAAGSGDSTPSRSVQPIPATRAGRLLDDLLDRLLRHLDQEPHRLPGLHFGFAGTAWALCDAGRSLGRPHLVDRAVELALRLPVVWPAPGLAHGVAGLGTCLLHLWEQTHRPELCDRIAAAADHLLGTVDGGGDGPMLWTVDPAFDSRLAGQRSYGFAHGTAGIGGYLLAAGHLLGRRDLVGAARRCGDTLLDAARHDGDEARWPSTPGAPAALTHWCDGSSGVGTFLCRLYARTGDVRYRDTAVAAARAVLRDRWTSGSGYCHGLAGDGDFLLDLARVTGEDRYLRWAEALAGRLWAMRVYRDGGAVVPDESGRRITGGFGAGLTGHLAFLLRLRHGGPRLFHPDPDVPATFGPGADLVFRPVEWCPGGAACRC